MNYQEIRRALHRIPEIGFEEFETQAFLLKQIGNMSQDHLQIKKWRTGLLVRVAGTNPTKTIGYRTDIDALPVEEKTGYAFASEHPGKMHACGHDFHMTVALGVLEKVAAHPIKDNAVFIFSLQKKDRGCDPDDGQC
jgi:Metal-dependent amidase/aminoacylase/carboxypeptidase